MLSTEVIELVELMDRVLVFREGELFTELARERADAASVWSPATSGGSTDGGRDRPPRLRAVRHLDVAEPGSKQPAAFSALLAVLLLIVNIIVQPDFVASGQIAGTLGTLAPFAIAGMASTPAILSGGGGIDLSVAPLMGFTNILLVTKLLGTTFGGPVLAVPILLDHRRADRRDQRRDGRRGCGSRR